MAKTQATPTTPKRRQIARMHVTVDYPPKRAVPNHGKWQYNEELRLILHDSNSCQLCKRWLHHYITELASGDGDLKRARDVLNRASTAQKAVDDAQRKRDEAFRDLATARERLAYTQAILRKARESRDMARAKVTNNYTE